MKSYAVLAATFAGAALAQDMPMPSGECANLCINNMARIAQTEFSCEDSDISCFCTQSNWAFGIRDCTREACDADQSAAAVEWAYARCAGVAATASNNPAALPILTSAIASATAVSPTPSETDSDGVEVTNTVTSIVGSVTSSIASEASSAIDDAESAISSIESEIASVTSSLGDAVSSVTSEAGGAVSTVTDEAGDVVSTVTDAVGDAVSSATDAAGSAVSTVVDDAAPKMTGLPFAAGAGIAAWLLL